MDRELKEVLQDLSGDLKGLAAKASASSEKTIDLAPITSDIRDLKTHLGWHAAIGAVYATISGVVLGWLLLSHLPDKLATQKEGIAKDFQIELSKQLAPILTNLATLNARAAVESPRPASAVNAAIKGNSGNGGDRLSVETIIQVAGQAKASGIRSDPAVLKDSAAELLKATSSSPLKDTVWEAIAALMAYRSFLASGELPRLPPPFEGGRPYNQPSFDIPNGKVFAFGKTKPPNCTASEPLGSDLNKSVDSCPEWQVFEGKTGRNVFLDNKKIKNVIFKDAAIVYRGGPILLESVFFINCTFEISPDAIRTKDFVASVFASGRVTFNNS